MTTSSRVRMVPFFDYPRLFKDHEEEFVSIFRNVAGRGAFILQSDLVDFENQLRSYLGVKHAFGVANATDALIIALRAAGLQPGDEVIFCSHTFVATAAAIHFAGGVPVPVDCGPDHLIDPPSVEKAVSPRTKAIMPTQLNGRAADMDALQTIADRYGLWIVEDSAQGLGAKFKGRFAGTFGKAGPYSFYPAKILGCFGDGGALVTDDDAVAEKISLLREHGRGTDGLVQVWGLNSRLDNLQAAWLGFQFKYYDETVARRRKIAARYQQHLAGLSALALPPAPHSDPRHFDVYQNYEIEAERRDALKAFLRDHGVGTLIQWGGRAVHQFPALNLKASLPSTERMFTRCLMLPMNPMLLDEDVDYVCEKLHEFYQK